MALRSRTRTATPSSGPGRGLASDVRTRHHRRPAVRGRARQRYASAEELRRRAEVIFAERVGERRESGMGPPGGERGVGRGEDAGETGVRVGWGVGRGASGMGSRAGRPEDADEVGARAGRPEDADEVGARAGGAEEVGWGGARVGLGSGARGMGAPGVDVGGGVASAGRDAGDIGAIGGAGVGHAQAGWAGADPASVSEGWRGRAGLALRERMPVWLQARIGVERRSVVALAVLLVVAAGFAVQHFWAGRTQSVRAPEVVQAAAPFGERSAVPSAPGASGTPGPEIVVDVSGKVREPGIHRLPAGSRVADALRAAGGVRPGTDTDGLNRARFLVDGEQVVVGGPAVPGPGAGGTAAGGSAGAVPGAGPAAPVSLNTATVAQLDTLPGVGPVLAQHIVDYRTQHGGFRSVDELREVNGIGERRFADLRNLVRP